MTSPAGPGRSRISPIRTTPSITCVNAASCSSRPRGSSAGSTTLKTRFWITQRTRGGQSSRLAPHAAAERAPADHPEHRPSHRSPDLPGREGARQRAACPSPGHPREPGGAAADVEQTYETLCEVSGWQPLRWRHKNGVAHHLRTLNGNVKTYRDVIDPEGRRKRLSVYPISPQALCPEGTPSGFVCGGQ
jgi:hypothetical protein